MATNYTTKTAALRATKADMRQVAVSKKIEIGSGDTATKITDSEVSADKLLIGVDVKNDQGETERQRQSVLDLIQNAGLNVGADADSDYVPEAPVKTNKINFIGAYVNVVDNGEDGMNIYIGENNNNPSFSSLSDSFANSRKVYSSSSSEYSLPSDATAGSDYARVSALTENETVNVQGGNPIGNILKDAKVKVTVTSDKGTIVYETPETISSVAGETGVTKTARLNDGTTYADAPTSKTWDDTATTGIKIVGSSMIKYTSEDAKNGYTPNSSTGKFVITIDNDKVVGANGGWYQVNVKIGGTDKTTSKVFVYKASSLTSSNKPTLTTTWTAGATKHVSGVPYVNGGTLKLDVTNITGTQTMIHTKVDPDGNGSYTSDDYRLTITDSSGNVADFTKYVKQSALTLTSDATTKNTDAAVYSYSETENVTASSPTQVSTKITVTPHGQAGTAETAASAEITDGSGGGWVMTTYSDDTNGTGTSCIFRFYNDGQRKYNTLANVKNGDADVNYVSSTSLVGDGNYTSQLLVQSGQLKYPTSNNVSSIDYSGATGTRYFVAPLKFKHNAVTPINKLTVAVTGDTMKTSYANDKIRMYLVKKGNSNALVLNSNKMASSSYGHPVADTSAPTNGSWTCEPNYNGLGIPMSTVNGTTSEYYLVIEMVSGAGSIGQVTITANI